MSDPALTTLSGLLLQALELALVLALPALLAALATGLIMGAVQTVTQVQDPAIAFVPRLVAAAVALSMTAVAMAERLSAFTNAVLAELPKLAQ